MPAMTDAALDATAEALTRRVLAEVPADRPRGAADLTSLPAPLVTLLQARLGAAVDAAAPSSSAWLDAEAIRETTEAWKETALAAVHVPADVWPEAVREAAGLSLAHLVRPADTLAAVAFAGGRASLPIQVALDRVRAFGPYPYLPQIAARYADRKDLGAIDRVGLEQLFRRIDRRMVSTFGPDDWTTLLGPLFALVGPVGSPTGSVPTSLLRPLFEAKGAEVLAAELDGIDAITSADLHALLASTLVPADDASHERQVATHPPHLTAPPVPPVAEGVRPPTIGSKYLAPEFDAVDESEVLGPPVPAGSHDAPAAEAPGRDDDRRQEPVSQTDAMEEVRDAVAEPLADPDEAPGSNPLITPEAVARPVTPPASASFIFPEEEPDETPEATAPTAARPIAPLPGPPAAASPLAEPPPSEPEPSVPEAPPAEPSDEDEPLWKSLVREQADAPPPETASDDEEPLWKRFAQSDLAAKLPSPPSLSTPVGETGESPALDTLETRVLGDGARERRDTFVAELFDGSPSAYHRTLDRIDRSASYTEATGIISSDILRAHSVNPYTESMVAFIDAVQDHFDRR